MNLQDYLTAKFNDDTRATTDYALRVEEVQRDVVKFYMHPQGDQSKTEYLQVVGNTVKPWVPEKKTSKEAYCARENCVD